MVSIVKAVETDKWLPKEWRKCTVPILRQPAETTDHITGSAFILEYKQKLYIVTANHVVKSENLVMAFTKKTTEKVNVNFPNYQKAELKWIKHPAGLDIAAIPFYLPPELEKEIDFFPIPEAQWTHPKIKIGDWVAHLGYPLTGTSNYLNKTPCYLPQGMPGRIIKCPKPYLIMKTASAHGASGGPVFLKVDNDKPYLIGVVIEARMKGNPLGIAKVQYLEETTALFATLIKDILESDEMVSQS